MGFYGTPLKLREEDFEDNKRLRNHFKLMLNAALGKFAQKRSSEEVHFVKSNEEINRLAMQKKIVNINDICEDFCQINTEAPETFSPFGNSVIYSFITARTRIRLHQGITALDVSGFHIYYCDCDSLLFSAPCGASIPLEIGSSFGQFKSELNESAQISQFICHGRKNFKLSFTENNSTKSLFRIRGISLTSSTAKEAIEKTFLPVVEPNLPPSKIPQVRKLSKKMQTETKRQDTCLNQNIECQRFVEFETVSEETFPWGYERI